MRGAKQDLLPALYLFDIVTGKGFLGFLDSLFYVVPLVSIDLSVEVLQGPLDGVDEVVSVVANVGLLTTALVLLGVRLGIPNHLLDLRLRKATRSGNRNLLLLTGSEVL